jgi:hypothetical protein
MQFSLRAMFIATAFVAAASAATKYAMGHEPYIQLIAVFAVPIFVGAAVGTLAGQLWRWIRAGIWSDIALIGFIPLRMMLPR